MPEYTQDRGSTEPFEIVKRTEETNGKFVRFEATLYPSSDGGKTNLSHRRWMADNNDEHIHPKQEEHFKVLSGEYRVVIAGTGHTLTEGEEITVPANIPHKHWNPTDHPVRIANEIRPAYNAEALLTILFELAQTGKTNEEGLPPFLQFAVIQNTYPDHAYLTNLPIGVQKTLFTLLAPLGRLLGYEASPSLEKSSNDIF